jgi:hypothetical protein
MFGRPLAAVFFRGTHAGFVAETIQVEPFKVT